MDFIVVISVWWFICIRCYCVCVLMLWSESEPGKIFIITCASIAFNSLVFSIFFFYFCVGYLSQISLLDQIDIFFLFSWSETFTLLFDSCLCSFVKIIFIFLFFFIRLRAIWFWSDPIQSNLIRFVSIQKKTVMKLNVWCLIEGWISLHLPFYLL